MYLDITVVLSVCISSMLLVHKLTSERLFTMTSMEPHAYSCICYILRVWGGMKEILATVFQLLPSVLSLIGLVTISLFVYTILGIRLFGARSVKRATVYPRSLLNTLVPIALEMRVGRD